MVVIDGVELGGLEGLRGCLNTQYSMTVFEDLLMVQVMISHYRRR